MTSCNIILCCNAGRANGMTTFTSKVPDTITTWVASGFAVNSKSGLGVPATRAEVLNDI